MTYGALNVSYEEKEINAKAMIKLDIYDEIIGEVNFHTHSPSQTHVEVAKVKANIKKKAQTTTDTPQQILGAELRNASQDTAANIPSTSTLRRNVRKARKDNNVPHNPIARKYIPVLPEQYQYTVGRRGVLNYDSGIGDQERMFIFASQMGLQLLRQPNIGTLMGLLRFVLKFSTNFIHLRTTK